ncbi:MAG: tetratricopeptide repeat protein [Desulfobacterales bacterium]|nr:tetratricopeptide repeat protein [Desulfobacterales bacterium]
MRRVFFIFLVILCLAGCTRVERLPEEKHGRLYGVTKGLFRSRWWNYYERGLSFADGGFWEKAELDLREAIQQRKNDQRRARTYGRHFIKYFPHCELGAVLYKQGRTHEAVEELETSLATAKYSKTEFYLDLARKALIEKEQQDQPPPKINIQTPRHLFLTNALFVSVQGVARDKKNFVRHVTVDGRNVRVDVSDYEIPFNMEVPVHHGKNEISVQAVNLAGKTSESFVTVNADRAGPVISIEEPLPRVDMSDETGEKTGISVKGYVFDSSGLAEVIISKQKISLAHAPRELLIEEIIPLSEEKELVVKARDIAGNITCAKISLSREEACSYSNLLAENAVSVKPVLSDTGNMPGPAKDPFIRIHLNNPQTERVTYLDQAVIDGKIISHERNVKLFINKNEVVEAPRKVFHFSYLVKLEQGENLIQVMAMTRSHYSDAMTVKIKREITCVRKPEARLKLALNHFTKEMTRDVRVPLGIGFENRLAASMLEHKPRRFSSVSVVPADENDQGLETDTVRNLAKEKGYHCILFGNVEERMNSDDKNSIIISARIEDTESSDIIVRTTDVYGEDADKDNIDSILKSLVQSMRLKLIDEIPVVDGIVLDKPGKEWISVDLGKKEKIKKGMALIVYQPGETVPGFDGMNSQDAEELGEAKIREVRTEKSFAHLSKTSKKEKILPKHRVITR